MKGSEIYMSNKEIINNNNNSYTEEDIDVLEGLEAVRKRPGMYIGSTDSKGLHHLVYEIADNAVDEALAGYCTEIHIVIKKDNIITVTDNGRGIPVGIHPKTGKSTLELVLTKLHAGGKFGGGGYKTSGGLHGVGCSVVNALSEWLEAEVHRDRYKYYQKFYKGEPNENIKQIGKSNKTGTIITFKPDKEIFKTTNFKFTTLEIRVREMAFLNKGLQFILEDKRKGKEQIKEFKFDGGIKEFIGYINKDKTPMYEDIAYHERTIGDFNVEFAMQYITEFTENIQSYANNIKTVDGGKHFSAFKGSLLKAINVYAKEKNLIKSNMSFSSEDIREGVTAIISVKLPEPEFEGQTKGKLSSSEIRPAVNQTVFEYLEIYFKENNDIANVIVERAIEVRKMREKAKEARNKAKKRKRKPLMLEGKLAECSSKKPEECEIFIVEGESAGGSSKMARDRKTQSILPQKGKIPNVEKKNDDAIEDLEQPKLLAYALGCGYGDNFDIDKLKYHKIILMSDADVDGEHIFCLNFTFIYRFMRPLIENGYIYLANPPLYKNINKKEMYYTYTEDEQKQYLNTLSKNDITKLKVQRYKGLGEMNPDQLWETTMNPETRTLLQLTVEDFEEMDEMVSLLMGDKVEPRRDFINKEALLADIDY